MFAFTRLTQDANGEIKYSEGALFKLPAELGNRGQKQRYVSLARNGWHKGDFGSEIFVYVTSSRMRYAFPGLYPTDSDVEAKFGCVKMFSRTQIEKYISDHFSQEEAVRRHVERDLNLLIHDLRRLSNAIYHQAEAAKSETKARNSRDALIRINSVIAAQAMLKIRTDVLDFSASPDSFSDFTHVPVYRRVHKVVRCFKLLASNSGVAISLKGTSHGTSFGPNVLELVPYIIIDNAIKYSPRNSSVDVKLTENEERINLSVSSLGPQIKPYEEELIFEKGYRGEVAKGRQDSGSGIGLFLCRKIIAAFDGVIFVNVDGTPVPTSKGECRQVTFEVEVPRSRPS